MSRFTLRLLGTFEIGDDTGRVLPPPRRQCQALMAYLALADGRPIQRSELAVVLWPDAEAAKSAQSLRQTLSTLRRALPSTRQPWMHCRRDTVQLIHDVVETDLGLFRTLVRSDHASDWMKAADLWRGDLLQGFDAREEPFNAWLRQERLRLRASFYRQLYERIDAAIALRNTDHAITLAEACTRIDPLCEEAHRRLMELYSSCGRKRAAFRQFESLSKLLDCNLGVAPDDETMALHSKIRRGTVRSSKQITAPSQFLESRGLPRLIITLSRDSRYSSPRTVVERAFVIEFSNALVRTNLVEVCPGDLTCERDERQASSAECELLISIEPSLSSTEVALQLVQLHACKVVWGDSWQLSVVHGSKIDVEFVLRTAGIVAWQVTYAEAAGVSQRPEKELNARECVYRGLAQMNALTPSETNDALRLFRKAVQLDPDDPWAHACIAWCYRRHAQVAGLTMPRRNRQLALRHATRAMELDPRDPFILFHAAEAKGWFERDFRGAIAFAELSLDRDPSSTRAWTASAELLCMAGQPAKALEHARRAIDISPQDPSMWVPHMVISGAMMQLGRFEEAASNAERSLAHNPSNRSANLLLAASYGQMGLKDDARRAFKRATDSKSVACLEQLPQVFGLNAYQNVDYLLKGLKSANA